MSTRSKFRNVFEFNEESPEWKEAASQFPNKVPRFESKDEAMEFTKKHCRVGSNPDTPHLLHSVTTLISWDQITNHLLPRIKKYDAQWPAILPTPSTTADNRFTNSDPNKDSESKEGLLYEYLQSRMNLSIHRDMSYQSTINTLKYMFFHMKCGIFVMIRNNQVVIFCPFVNKDYKNSWKGALKVGSADGSLSAYSDEKQNHYRKENYIPMEEWWANGNIICNEYSNDTLGNQYWGDHFLLQIKDMLAETCNRRVVPDCEFFVNKRDYPHLKFNPDIAGGIPVEPYGFIFDKDDRIPEEDIPLNRHFYKSYAPILSFYSSSRFADIPIPPSEDWESATGMVFPSSFSYSLTESGEVVVSTPRDLFTAANLKKFDCAWADKVNTAFFRGTATGGGVTPATNQRIHLAQTCYDWSRRPELNGDKTNGVAFLDAKITGWNLRDKKIASQPMTHLRPRSYPFEGDKKKNFVPIYQQSSYKYLIYAEGHCAACRYGFMMQLGSVILKVESQCVADQMWYFPLLRPYFDHIPVKADLSDLQEKLEWCHAHDEECQQIARRAKEMYDKYVSRDGILDYLQAMCVEISKRYRRAPADWCPPAPAPRPVPSCASANGGYYNARFCTETQEYCSYCQAAMLRDEEEKKNNLLKNANASDSLKRQATSELDYKQLQKKALRERMRKKAATTDTPASP